MLTRTMSRMNNRVRISLSRVLPGSTTVLLYSRLAGCGGATSEPGTPCNYLKRLPKQQHA
eukprot:7779825-Alexandrium_andersonii.AAC.1